MAYYELNGQMIDDTYPYYTPGQQLFGVIRGNEHNSPKVVVGTFAGSHHGYIYIDAPTESAPQYRPAFDPVAVFETQEEANEYLEGLLYTEE